MAASSRPSEEDVTWEVVGTWCRTVQLDHDHLRPAQADGGSGFGAGALKLAA